ncbi:unnamed protein product [Clonostachys solani]|uniref:Uncharacterized protein n=1 Tax=Clonostachys solani TaxID=160281 RepID=A0A9N9YP34_9HYPO|nr:unnamed protein product [Clonostachys solani]
MAVPLNPSQVSPMEISALTIGRGWYTDSRGRDLHTQWMSVLRFSWRTAHFLCAFSSGSNPAISVPRVLLKGVPSVSKRRLARISCSGDIGLFGITVGSTGSLSGILSKKSASFSSSIVSDSVLQEPWEYKGGRCPGVRGLRTELKGRTAGCSN